MNTEQELKDRNDPTTQERDRKAQKGKRMSFIKKANSVNEKRTICEVHREIYDVACVDLGYRRVQVLVALLDEANTMAKKMGNKLREYHYEKNKKYDESKELRKNRALHPK